MPLDYKELVGEVCTTNVPLDIESKRWAVPQYTMKEHHEPLVQQLDLQLVRKLVICVQPESPE